MFGLSTAKLIGFAVGVVAILAFVGLAFHWKSEMTHRGQQIAAACDATRKAADRPKLDCKQMPQQIQFLGDALTDVKAKTDAAQASDAAHAQNVETQQNKTSQESSNDYQAAIAAVRADYAERLRRAEQAAANSGRSGKPPVPGASPSASGSDAAAAQAQLPSPDALTATEQAIQLKAIQDWACREGLFIARCPAPAVQP